MDILAIINLNAVVGMISAATAVFVGVKIREIGLRVYILVLITAVLSAAAVIETWFSDSTVMKSATIGWVIGYITDDVLLSVNSMLPNFIRDLLNSIAKAVKFKVNKWIGIDKPPDD